MATVRMSGVLKQDILRNLSQSYDHRLVDWDRNNPRPEDWGSRIYDTLVPQDLKDKLKAIPNGWLETTSTIKLNGFKNVADDSLLKLPRELTSSCYSDEPYYMGVTLSASRLEWELPQREPVPVHKEESLFSYERLVVADDNRFEWLRVEYAKWIQPLQELLAERRKMIDNVKALLDSHKTLAPMLKKWDGLWGLLPEEAKDRHKQVVERNVSSTEDKTDGIDFNEVTSHLTMNKLMEK